METQKWKNICPAWLTCQLSKNLGIQHFCQLHMLKKHSAWLDLSEIQFNTWNPSSPACTVQGILWSWKIYWNVPLHIMLLLMCQNSMSPPLSSARRLAHHHSGKKKRKIKWVISHTEKESLKLSIHSLLGVVHGKQLRGRPVKRWLDGIGMVSLTSIVEANKMVKGRTG